MAVTHQCRSCCLSAGHTSGGSHTQAPCLCRCMCAGNRHFHSYRSLKITQTSALFRVYNTVPVFIYLFICLYLFTLLISGHLCCKTQSDLCWSTSQLDVSERTERELEENTLSRLDGMVAEKGEQVKKRGSEKLLRWKKGRERGNAY